MHHVLAWGCYCQWRTGCVLHHTGYSCNRRGCTESCITPCTLGIAVLAPQVCDSYQVMMYQYHSIGCYWLKIWMSQNLQSPRRQKEVYTHCFGNLVMMRIMLLICTLVCPRTLIGHGLSTSGHKWMLASKYQMAGWQLNGGEYVLLQLALIPLAI